MARKTRPTRQSSRNNQTAKGDTAPPEDAAKDTKDPTAPALEQDTPHPGSDAPPPAPESSATDEAPKPEDVTPEGAAPEDTTPEDTAPGEATPEGAAPEEAAPEHAAPEDSGNSTADAATETPSPPDEIAAPMVASADETLSAEVAGTTPEGDAPEAKGTAAETAEALPEPEDTAITDDAAAGDATHSDDADTETRSDALMAAAVPAAAGMAAAGAATATASPQSTGTSASDAPPPRDSAPTAPPPRRSAFPMFLGGIVAAGLGAGATWYAADQGWIDMGPEVDLSAQDARLDSLRADLATLQEQLAAEADRESVAPEEFSTAIDSLQTQIAETADGFEDLRASVSDNLAELDAARGEAREIGQAMGSLLQRLERAEESIAGLDTATDSLAAQGETMDQSLSALSVRVAAIQAAQEALQADIDDVRALADARIEDVQAAAAAAAAEADQRAARAEAIAALDTIEAALQSGSSYATALARVEAVADDIPAALHAGAADGIATLTELQEDFGSASRAGLRAALQGMDYEGTTDRIGSFLRSQIGARSLAPRAGDDPDAVMSRATHAVETGDLNAALLELEALPEAGRAAMSDWISAARTRLDAIAGLDALKQTMTAG